MSASRPLPLSGAHYESPQSLIRTSWPISKFYLAELFPIRCLSIHSRQIKTNINGQHPKETQERCLFRLFHLKVQDPFLLIFLKEDTSHATHRDGRQFWRSYRHLIAWKLDFPKSKGSFFRLFCQRPSLPIAYPAAHHNGGVFVACLDWVFHLGLLKLLGYDSGLKDLLVVSLSLPNALTNILLMDEILHHLLKTVDFKD